MKELTDEVDDDINHYGASMYTKNSKNKRRNIPLLFEKISLAKIRSIYLMICSELFGNIGLVKASFLHPKRKVIQNVWTI